MQPSSLSSSNHLSVLPDIAVNTKRNKIQSLPSGRFCLMGEAGETRHRPHARWYLHRFDERWYNKWEFRGGKALGLRRLLGEGRTSAKPGGIRWNLERGEQRHFRQRPLVASQGMVSGGAWLKQSVEMAEERLGRKAAGKYGKGLTSCVILYDLGPSFLIP